MRQCPSCNVELMRLTYEGQVIRACSQCGGKLVERNDLLVIQRRRDMPQEALRSAIEAAPPSSAQTLQCPRCHLDMEKEILRGAVLVPVDTCTSCDLIWFDGGELEMAQLAYETSTRGAENERFRQRLEEMPPERRAIYEENMRRLRDMPAAVEQERPVSFGSFGSFMVSLLKRRVPGGL